MNQYIRDFSITKTQGFKLENVINVVKFLKSTITSQILKFVI